MDRSPRQSRRSDYRRRSIATGQNDWGRRRRQDDEGHCRRDRRHVRRRRSRSSSRSSRSDSSDCDDNAGEIVTRPGDLIAGRYEVVRVAGKGTFGKVLSCRDRKRNCLVAVKAVRSVPRYLDSAKIEIDILEAIQTHDPDHKSLCVRLLNWFSLRHNRRDHVFIVFEHLGMNLYEFIKGNNYHGLPRTHVRAYARQLIHAVKFCHSMQLIHTDLKLENIMLMEDDYDLDPRSRDRIPRCMDIRLIDFGGATFEHEHHSRIINTRQYRAPEVILGLPWSLPTDMWSVGCILAELASGELLFPAHGDLEHFAFMEHILERLTPIEMVRAALAPFQNRNTSPSNASRRRRDRSSSEPRPDKLFRRDSFRREKLDARVQAEVQQYATLKNLISPHDTQLFDLINGLLEFDPRTRLTAAQALNHPYFRDSY